MQKNRSNRSRRRPRPAAYTVACQHRGFGQAMPFTTFRRGEKLEAFACLRRLSRAWPNSTYYLKHERRTIVRIEVGDLFDHLPRGNVTRRVSEKFRADIAALGVQL